MFAAAGDMPRLSKCPMHVAQGKKKERRKETLACVHTNVERGGSRERRQAYEQVAIKEEESLLSPLCLFFRLSVLVLP